MADIVYNAFKQKIADGTIDWDAATVRVLLIRSTSTYTADPDHEFVSDLTGLAEPTDGSYARQSLAGKLVAKDNANNRAVLDANDTSFGNVAGGQTVIGYICYVQTGGSDASPGDDTLVCHVDSPADKVLQGDPFTVVWNAAGVVTLT